MPTPNADCSMCSHWQMDHCRQIYGRCSWQEEQAMEGVYQGGGPRPQWIECWMAQDADASTCDGFEITDAGQRELDIINTESVPDGHKPTKTPDWVRHIAGDAA